MTVQPRSQGSLPYSSTGAREWGGGTGEGEPWEETLKNLRPLQRYLSLIFPHLMR